MGLSGWNSNNKLKLTIDGSKIDGDLTDFPVLVTLSSGSGQTGYDTTDVFDELSTASGSYNNRKKIAVTTTISGVETELYVEIERWDDKTAFGNEQAWLWAKVPTLVSGTDTDLYLYYDSTHADNVYELGNLCIHSDDTDGSTTFIDSSFSNHIISYAGDVHHETDQAKFGISSIYFDGVGDYLSMLDSEDWTFGTGNFTIDFWIKRGRVSTREMVWGQCVVGGTANTISIRMEIAADDVLHFYLMNVDRVTGYHLNDTDWHHILVERYGTNLLLFVDGNLEYTVSIGAGALINSTTPWSIGRQGDYPGLYFQGYIDEYHIVKGTALHVSNFTPPTSQYKMGYIGDVGETTAQNVWDSNFNAVFHFSEDSYTGAASEIRNSTGGTGGHAINSAQPFDALIGNGIEIDDANKGAITESTINPGNVYTAESFFFKPWSPAGVNALFKSTSPNQYFVLIDTDNLLAVYDGAWRKSSYNLNTISDGWHHLAAVSDDTNTYFYVDSVYVASVAYHCIGGFDNFGGFVTQSWGDVDDVRVSDVQRSASWIKATYYTGMDDLITFEGEPPVIYYFSGDVYELENTISGAQIYVYRRDTGVFIGSTTSSGDGGFYVETSYSGAHFLVCLDPAGSQSYNDLVYGEMYPITISG